MTIKYIATATRQNLPGCEYYRQWRHTYTDGKPVLYDTEARAIEVATWFCADNPRRLCDPKAEQVAA